MINFSRSLDTNMDKISETSTECNAWISDNINNNLRNYLFMP